MILKKNQTHKLFYLPLLALSTSVSADFKTDIGYTALQNELGSSTPSGAGVKVAQAEASSVPDTNPNYPVFAPDPSAGTYTGKTFSYPGLTCGTPPCIPGQFSGHAMGVADVFYGNTVSIAQGITDIHSYDVNQWLDSLYIQGSSGQVLGTTKTDRRIANHSWVGSASTSADTSGILRIVDRQVERNEYIQVAATSSQLLGNAYNAIAVGLTDGSASGSDALDSTYVAGRTRPDIVAPAAFISTSTPMVASAAAVLVETGHQGGTNLSNGSKTITPDTGAAFTVYNAERSETIKAALMAGADRQTANTGTYGNITDYLSSGHETANGLDDRYGAGQVNIYNSYQIIAAGEQNSLQDGGANNGQIDLWGFDYDEAFGDSAGSNANATYTFTANSNENLSATLAWNLEVSNNNAMTATLRHFSLSLVDVTNNQVIASSNSLVDNTQNLFWLGLIGGHDYQIQVTSMDGAVNWDYALAWNRSISANPVPLPAAFWLFGAALTSLVGYHRKRDTV